MKENTLIKNTPKKCRNAISANKKTAMRLTPYGFWNVKLMCYRRETLRTKRGKTDLYPLLILRGWCYDWGKKEGCPTFNLNIVTFYLRDRLSSKEKCNKDKLKDRLENVIRA